MLQITAGMEDLGGMQWELLGCLILGWFMVYLIIWKGLHASGKVCVLLTVWKNKKFTFTCEIFREMSVHVQCNLVLKCIDFTEFLPKYGESKFPKFSHCALGTINS